MYDEFEVTPALLTEVLAAGLARGGDFCELYFQFRHSDNLWLEDHQIRGGSLHVLRGMGVRVLRGDQTGVSHTASLDRQSLLAAAGIAACIADSGQSGQPVAADPARSAALPRHYPASGAALDVTGARKWLERLDRKVFGLDRRVIKASCGLRCTREQILVVNSEGLVAWDDRPQFGVWSNCIAEHQGRREENGFNHGSRTLQSATMTAALLDRVARQTVDLTVRLFEAVEAPAGEMPLVLAAGEGGILVHEAMGHGFEADFIRKGTSIFAGRLGQMCASPEVTVVDSGILPDQWGSINMDDEGHPAQETVLVDQGRLNSWIHDRLSARHFNCPQTGNGRRQDYTCLPIPRMTSTYIKPGRHSREEIIGSIKQGIYAEQFSNGQVNIGPGDFTFYMKSGWLIEDGKLTRPVKDVNLIGNGPKVLQELEMVGNDLAVPNSMGNCGKNGQGVPVSFGMPTLKVKHITVGGRN